MDIDYGLNLDRIKRSKEVQEKDSRMLEEARWRLKMASYLNTPNGRKFKENLQRRIIELGG